MGELHTSRRLLKSLSGKSKVKKVGIIYKIGKEPRLLVYFLPALIRGMTPSTLRHTFFPYLQQL